MIAIEFAKWNGVGKETDYQSILKHYQDAERIELFRREKIILLNIRFSELFHRCSDTEWSDFLEFLENKSIPKKLNKWWKFWER